MWLVVGLGNPGSKYAKNRHDVGFMVTERPGARWKAPAANEKFSGLWTKASFAGDDAVLLQPQTYMNLSGESVQKAMAFFKVPLSVACRARSSRGSSEPSPPLAREPRRDTSPRPLARPRHAPRA